MITFLLIVLVFLFYLLSVFVSFKFTKALIVEASQHINELMSFHLRTDPRRYYDKGGDLYRKRVNN